RNTLDWQLSKKQHVIDILPQDAAMRLFRDRLQRQSRKDEVKSDSSVILIQDMFKQIGYHTLSMSLLGSEFDRLIIPLTDFVHDIIKRLLEVRNDHEFKALDFCLGRSVESLDEKLKMALGLAALLNSEFDRDNFSELTKSILVNSNQEGKPVQYFDQER